MSAARRAVTAAALFAVLASAALAHAALGALSTLGRVAGDDAYAHHAHGAVAPVAFAAALLLSAVLVRFVASALARADGSDPFLALARRLRRRNPVLPAAIVSAGTLLTLIAMEFGEQFAADGQVEGLAAALGGNVLLGLGVVVGVAATLTVLCLRLATALAASRIIAQILSVERPPVETPVCGRSRAPRPRPRAGMLLARGFGLRAPPL